MNGQITEKTSPVSSEQEAARTRACLETKNPPAPAKESNHGHPAHSRTLYWLRNPSSFCQEIVRKFHIHTHSWVQRQEAAAGKPLASMAIYEIRSDDDH
jgi:hypothetical protein